MMRSSFGFFALVGLALTTQPGMAADPAPEPDQKPAATEQATTSPQDNLYLRATGTREQGAASEPVVVYTNDDLERLFGGRLREDGTDVVTTEPTPKASRETKRSADADPLAWVRDRQRRQAERDGAIAAAAAEVARLEQRVKQLTAGVLVTHNPLLPRRVAPKKPADDAESDLAENWDQLDQRGRVEGTQDELKAAQDELAAARSKLNQLRAN